MYTPMIVYGAPVQDIIEAVGEERFEELLNDLENLHLTDKLGDTYLIHPYKDAELADCLVATTITSPDCFDDFTEIDFNSYQLIHLLYKTNFLANFLELFKVCPKVYLTMDVVSVSTMNKHINKK